ncbi:MAG TPA: hypothetical protein PKC14_00175 [Candidatus Absconditabacterales bacterium]|nr:hypothetical protein [Candidatus Absconditabacterales bacterium]
MASLTKEKQSIIKSSGDKIFNTETMLPFSEIRGNTVLMKDGSIRAIMKVSGLNLDLKNAEEQEVVIEQYRRFLNGLEFPVQILIRNSYLDLSQYIGYMRQKVSLIENAVLKAQSDNYLQFLETIDLKQGLIYTKEFYVVVPYYSDGDDNSGVSKSWFSQFMAVLDSTETPEKIISRYRSFVKNKTYLDTRCSLVVDGLSSLGMDVERLDTAEIVSLLFKFYNPMLHNSQADYSGVI